MHKSVPPQPRKRFGTAVKVVETPAQKRLRIFLETQQIAQAGEFKFLGCTVKLPLAVINDGVANTHKCVGNCDILIGDRKALTAAEEDRKTAPPAPPIKPRVPDSDSKGVSSPSTSTLLTDPVSLPSVTGWSSDGSDSSEPGSHDEGSSDQQEDDTKAAEPPLRTPMVLGRTVAAIATGGGWQWKLARKREMADAVPRAPVLPPAGTTPAVGLVPGVPRVQVVTMDLVYLVGWLQQRGLKPAVIHSTSGHAPTQECTAGAVGHEANLLRRTTLFQSVCPGPRRVLHKPWQYPLVDTDVLYCPNVYVLRYGEDRNYEMLHTPFSVCMLLAAPIAKPKVVAERLIPIDSNLTKRKLRAALQAAAWHGHNIVLLEPWGWQTGHPDRHTAQLCREVLFEGVFQRAFQLVIFVVWNDMPEEAANAELASVYAETFRVTAEPLPKLQ